MWAIMVTHISKAALSLTCKDVVTFLWSIAYGGAALYINPETYQRMCARADDLADVFDNEQQSMLIWTSVLLPVKHGSNTERIMHRDVLQTLSKWAPPGTYPSAPTDSEILPDKPEQRRIVVVSEEFAKLAVDDECECLSIVGQGGGPPAWQAGTNPILTSKHSNGRSKL